MARALEEALALWESGINIVPAERGGKAPLGAWKRWQTERVPRRMVEEWWSGDKPPNIFVITGRVSMLVVLDIDSEETLEAWKRRLGDDGRTATVKTGRGWHLYYKLQAGQDGPKGDGPGWTLRGEGGGVIAPPSTHETGAVYQWQGCTGAGEATRTFLLAPVTLWEAGAGASPNGGAPAEENVSLGLARLLADPPKGEGERHTWLARVAGHYAKQLLFQDAFNWHVEQAASLLDPPIEREGIENLKRNLWRSEHERHDLSLKGEVERLRIRERAREIVAEERAEAAWKPAPLDELGELLKGEDAPVEWAVQGLHEQGDNTLLAAEYKIGKTTLLLNLAKALVDDELFLGHWLAGSVRNVMLYDFESPEPRLRRWCRDIGVARTERVKIVRLRGYNASMMTEQGREQTIHTLAKHNVSDWIIDPFGRALEGNENATDEVRAFVDNLDLIKREAGVQNLYIATHTGRATPEKGKEHARGASVLDDWTDNRWIFTRDGDNRIFRAVGRGEEVPDSELDYNADTRRLTLIGNQPGQRADHAREQLLWQLTGRELKQEQVLQLLTGTKKVRRERLAALVAEGTVLKRNGPRNVQLYTRARGGGQQELDN